MRAQQMVLPGIRRQPRTQENPGVGAGEAARVFAAPGGAGAAAEEAGEMKQIGDGKFAIDPKFHVEGSQIVKTSNGQAIPDDEPVILFRARDRHALGMLYYYRGLCVRDNCTPYLIDGIDSRIAAFLEFRQKHLERMKQPGCTMGR